MRLIPFALVLRVCSLLPIVASARIAPQVFAPEQRELAIRHALVLPLHHEGRTGRMPVHRDAIEERIVRGS